MKKSGLFVISLLLISFLALVVHAQEAPGLNEIPLGNELQAGQQQYEQYTTAENKSAYLTQEWSNLLGKAKIIGPIHNFLTAHQLIFQIVFAHPYEISFTFFIIIILWIIIALHGNKLLKSAGIIKPEFSWIAGILIAILLAQTGLYSIIGKGLSDLIFSQGSWWLRAILIIVILAILFVIYIIGNQVEAALKKAKKSGEIAGLERKVERQEELYKGLKKGEEISRRESK
jgi:hypothetical protein